ncbi:MAG: folate-binding protein [Pseudomonadota bacterium]
MTTRDAALLGRAAPERAVVAMAGGDALSVLQDVVTNDVGPVMADPTRVVYAALLTPQGKYLFDFFVLQGPAGEGLLIDVAAERAAALAKRIGMYCLRRDARVVGETGLAVGQIMPAALRDRPGQEGTDASLPEALPAELPAALPGTLPDGLRAIRDPRHPALGWRLYAPDAATLEAGLAASGADTLDAEALAARRIALGVPESGVELVPEETFPLEAGLDVLSGIDFRKGCYVGQEVTARMRHKTVLRKRLVRVSVTGAAPSGTPVTTAEGKPAGTLFTQAGGAALAHLRLDRAEGPLRAGEAEVTLPD